MVEIRFDFELDKEKLKIKNLDKLSFTQVSLLKLCVDIALDLVLNEKMNKELKLNRKNHG